MRGNDRRRVGCRATQRVPVAGRDSRRNRSVIRGAGARRCRSDVEGDRRGLGRGRAHHAPEHTRARDKPVRLTLDEPAVDHVERLAVRIEAGVDGALQPSVVAPRRGSRSRPVHGEGRDDTRVQRHAHHLSAGVQCGLSRLRDEGLAHVTEGGAAREVEATRGGPRTEARGRGGRKARVRGQESRRPFEQPLLRRLRQLRRLRRLPHRLPRGEVGEAVPAPGFDEPQDVGRILHRAAPARLHARVGGDESSIGGEGQPERVAQAPGHQLRRATGGADTQDRAGAGHLTSDVLAGVHPLPEGNQAARGRLLARGPAERVRRAVIVAHQAQVLARDVVEGREAAHPPSVDVVLAHHTRVGGRSDAEVEEAVRADHGSARGVIAHRRQVAHDGDHLPGQGDPEDLPGPVPRTARRDEERALVPGDPRPRRPREIRASRADGPHASRASRHGAKRSSLPHLQQPGRPRIFRGVTRLQHVHASHVVEHHGHGRGQASRDDLQVVARWNGDVVRADLAEDRAFSRILRRGTSQEAGEAGAIRERDGGHDGPRTCGAYPVLIHVASPRVHPPRRCGVQGARSGPGDDDEQAQTRPASAVAPSAVAVRRWRPSRPRG
ncbi:Hypothetical protein CAP_8150 [Chondromyces apiculatus DSM 436]|uniref:Uncharacterized protein n=1 Tax=Chondromyces apiculatus DSM 436 TaxID=1192034 RepID=A0A017TEJ2_9BACT|nr:Hypothetical protein CAP_8150 [Chondromyces apiculatus DSM 436]